jgi:acetoin utilization deacetylase AcuC-like enzyme
MQFIFSEKCLEYESPGHPENPARVAAIYNLLKSKEAALIEPLPCAEEDILSVHAQDLLNNVKKASFFDPDTPALPDIYEHARLSAGGAILASQTLGFSVMRPPGHHAQKNHLGGFCYFNNIAIAIKSLGKRAAILDIDCHHGNGTEDIFSGNSEVLYASLHRYGFFYPGTGGESKGNIRNFPLQYGISESQYIETLRQAIDEINEFDPLFLGVSIGFDTYKLDPVGGLGLEIESYGKIGKLIREIDTPTFYVLEGGYSPDIGECLWQFVGL